MESDFTEMVKAQLGDIKSSIHIINRELGQMATKEQIGEMRLEMAEMRGKMLSKTWFLATVLGMCIAIIGSIFAGLQFFMQLLTQLV